MKADPVLERLIRLRQATYEMWLEAQMLLAEYRQCQAAKAEQAKQARRAA